MQYNEIVLYANTRHLIERAVLRQLLFNCVLNVSIPTRYWVLIAYSVLIPASVTLLVVVSPGPCRVLTMWLTLLTAQNAPHSVR